MTSESTPSKELANRLRQRCGHDSWSVDGCLDCDAADELETLQTLSNAVHKAFVNAAIKLAPEPKPAASKEKVWSDARILDEMRDYDPCLSSEHVAQVFAQALALIEHREAYYAQFTQVPKGDLSDETRPDLVHDLAKYDREGLERLALTQYNDCERLMAEVTRLREKLQPSHEPCASLDEHDAGIVRDLEAMAANQLAGFWPQALAIGALRLIKRSAPPPLPEQWQSIETAPKDGTKILLGYFPEPAYEGASTAESCEVAFWHGIHKKWCGRVLLNADGVFSPTHWMPLPPYSGSTKGESR